MLTGDANKLRFLFKECEGKISTSALLAVLNVPDYTEALMNVVNSGEQLDSEKVYEIIKETWIGLVRQRAAYRGAFRAFRSFAADFKGDRSLWDEDIPQDVKDEYSAFLAEIADKRVELPEGFEDLSWVLDVTEPLNQGTRRRFCSNSEMLENLRQESAQDLQAVYRAFSKVFFPIVRDGVKQTKKEQKRFEIFQRDAENYCRVLFEDKNHWRSDCVGFRSGENR